MSSRRPYLLITLSFFSGVLVLFLFKSWSPEEIKPGDSWAVLVLDESSEDRRIRESLSEIGPFISESSQEITIDDFGSVKKIPLDSFYDGIEMLDPRNDGYAEKLRSFFVRDGKRYFFLPLDSTVWNRPGKLKKALVPVLGDEPYTFAVLGSANFKPLHFTLLAAACLSALLLSKSRRLFAPVLPVLLSLAWGGALAMLLAAILAGIWELLREALGELSAAGSYRCTVLDYGGRRSMKIKERLEPFKKDLILALVFMFFFLAVFFIGGFPPVPLAAALGSFFFLYFLSSWLESRRVLKTGHTLFRPVQLGPSKFRLYSLFSQFLPFGAAFALAVLAPVYLPGLSSSTFNFSGKELFIDPAYYVSAEDYEKHAAFQRSFSWRSMEQAGRDEGGEAPDEYLRYYLNEDGLIGGSESAERSLQAGDSRFPLEKLMDFLIQYYKPGAAGAGGRQDTAK